MARLVALEWDEREARVAVAASRRGEVVVEQAFTVALHPERPTQSPAEIGAKLGAALNARGISGRVECLIAVGRSSIELRNLSLPPSPDDELPEMVRFQAMREFNTLGDDWPLDFVPIGGSATEPRSVLAAAISPDLVTQIEATCQGAGLKPQRLILRACAAAALLNRVKPATTEKVRLLVDLLADEADLTILVNETVVFLRTARLPGEPGSPEQARGLIAETRRTMVASQNRLGGSRVESIFLCGGEQSQSALIAQMRTELALPVELFQPFATVPCAPDLQQNLPSFPGRFTPLLGILLDEGLETPHSLDFLHPRKKPEPPSHRNQYMWAGGLAASLLLLIGGWLWWSLGSLDSEIATTEAKLKDLEPVMKKADDLNKRMTALDGWLAGDITWLDEIRELSTRFPSSKEAMLTNLLLLGHKSGGEIQLDGLVKTPSVVDPLERALRNPKHKVETRGGDQAINSKAYPWHFKSNVAVEK